MFAVGGAGAQKDLVIAALKSLKEKIIKEKIRIILVAGVRPEIKEYFEKQMENIGLTEEINRGIKILFSQTKAEYFKEFNLVLRGADILWTKPSELSFFANLCLPIIIAPAIGSHEKFNERWLLNSG